MGESGPVDGGFGAVDLRRVQPFEATKAYVCPGCHHRIAIGTGHYVAVPADAPDLRRHWHKPCWDRRQSQRPNTEGSAAS